MRGMQIDRKMLNLVQYLVFLLLLVRNPLLFIGLYLMLNRDHGISDTISYFTMILGVMRCGLACFPSSTRNSAAAVAHLIRTTGLLQLFVSSDPAMQRLAHDAAK